QRFKDFLPREDVQTTQWFRMQNSWVRDPEFLDMPNDHRITWVAILSAASEKIKTQGRIKIETTLFATYAKTTEDEIVKAINRFQELGHIALHTRTAHVPDTSRARTATRQDKTEQDKKTRQEKAAKAPP